MGSNRIQSPLESGELDDVVEKCLQAENETNDSTSKHLKEEALKGAKEFLVAIKVAEVASTTFFVCKAYLYLREGDILSALDVVFSTLLPRLIRKLKKMITKDRQKKSTAPVKPDREHDPPTK